MAVISVLVENTLKIPKSQVMVPGEGAGCSGSGGEGMGMGKGFCFSLEALLF